MAAPREVLRRLLKQGALLVAVTVLGLIGGAAYAMLKTPAYAAQAHVVVVATESGDEATSVKFAQAYGRIVTEPVVLAQTTATARGSSTGELRRRVRVATSPDAPLVELTGTGGTPQQAANLANEVAQALVSFGNSRTGQTGVRLAIFAEASPPDAPSSPNLPLDVVVGGAAGVLVGGLAAMAGVGSRPSRPADQRPVRGAAAARRIDLDSTARLSATDGVPAGPEATPVSSPNSRP